MDNEAITPMTAEQAWNFLGDHHVGRIALAISGQPEIFPVNYVTAGNDIIFRTAEGTKLLGVVIDGRVAFEVDDIGDTHGASVVAKGIARRVEAHDEQDLLDVERLKPWVPTLKHHFVAISVQEISGLKFQFGPEPERTPVM